MHNKLYYNYACMKLKFTSYQVIKVWTKLLLIASLTIFMAKAIANTHTYVIHIRAGRCTNFGDGTVFYKISRL